MMSGSVLAPWAIQPKPKANAQRLARAVGCFSNESEEVLECLQERSMSEIVSAVDDMIRDGNISAIFAPVVDADFLNLGPSAIANRFMDLDPKTALERGQFKKVTTPDMNE